MEGKLSSTYLQMMKDIEQVLEAVNSFCMITITACYQSFPRSRLVFFII